MNNLKNFWFDEDGMGTVEVIMIIIVLLGLALLFRQRITTFVTALFDNLDVVIE